jgi:AcrR family transcriptional regulator
MSTATRPERTRLLEAMLEELTEKGYLRVEVEAAIRRAELVGEEWSQQFPDKDACLVAAFDELTEQLRVAIVEGCGAGDDWPARVAGGLRTLLAQLSSRAALAEGLAQTFPAIGPAAQARYQAFVESLAPLLYEGRSFSGMADELPGEVEMLAVGAAEAIVIEQIRGGHTAQLQTIGHEILFSVLVPFIGPVAAAREMKRERAGHLNGRRPG